MPWNVGSKTISRFWAFVDRFTAGQTADRDEFDAAFDDVTASVNDALSFYDGRVAALETSDEWYLGVSATDPTTARDGGPLVSGMFYVRSPEMSLRVLDAGTFRQIRAIGSVTPYAAALLEVTDEEDAALALGLGTMAYEAAASFPRLTADGGVTLNTNSAVAATGGLVQMSRARGTAATPVAVNAGDTLGALKVRGYNSSAAFEDAFEMKVIAQSAAGTFAPTVIMRAGGQNRITLFTGSDQVTVRDDIVAQGDLSVSGTLTVSGLAGIDDLTASNLTASNIVADGLEVGGDRLTKIIRPTLQVIIVPFLGAGVGGTVAKTLTGVEVGDRLLVHLGISYGSSVLPTGLIFVQAVVTAADEVTYQFYNAASTTYAGGFVYFETGALRLTA